MVSYSFQQNKKEVRWVCNFKISKINRLANVMARQIAEFSFDNRVDGALANNVPLYMVNFGMNDCNNSFI